MMIALYIVLGLIALFLAVILIRTAAFTDKKTEKKEYEKIEFDREKAVTNLQKLVRCKTVSYRDQSLEDPAEFQKLWDLLPELFPNVYKVCTLERLPDKALLFHWKGKNPGNPGVLMAHYDVVPVNEEEWEKPPFEGIIEDGVLWGRGSIDTKVTFSGVLTAADHLIAQGFVPERDFYFAFSGGEEINGMGAVNIVNWFKERNIVPEFVIDEGGAVVNDVFPGVTEACGLIGIAEKGMIDLEYSVKSHGGHASAPAPHTPVGVLADACCKVENHPAKLHITKPVAGMFNILGRHSTFVYKMIFANLWCFKPVLDMICKKSGGTLNALMRTTVAFTQMEGSSASNVIPPEASILSNIRLNPMDTVDSEIAYIKKIIKNDDIKLTPHSNSMNPSHISRTDVHGYEIVEDAIKATWNNCLVAPYLMVQCSDSRHYDAISDRVYRFCAIDMTNEELGLIHGNNERLRTDAIARAVEFYIRVMKSC